MRNFKWLLLFVSLNVFADKPLHLKSIDSDDKTKLIFGNELNFYSNTVYENTSLQYYGHSWNVGIQSLNIRLSGSQAQNYESDTYFNLGKSFEIFDKTSLEFSGMVGTNFDGQLSQLHATGSTTVNYQVFTNMSVYGGMYYVNDSLATIHQPLNFMSGFKLKLLEKIVIVGDYYGGYNNLSGSMVNVYYKLTPNFRPYVGIQVPEKNSGNEFCGTVGFSLKLN